jgi:peptidoglycan hydrolase-like protein with peptidoglycan-binding domain
MPEDRQLRQQEGHMSVQITEEERVTEVEPPQRRPAPRRLRIIVLAVLTGGVLAAAMAFAVSPGMMFRHGTASASAASDAQAASQRHGGLADQLRVLSISPGDSADPVSVSDPVRVVFSAPLSPESPLPVFSPPVAGRWQGVGGDALVFTPQTSLAPGTEVTLQVPAGRSGVRSATGAMLARPAAAVFGAGGPSTLRLEALLCQLGYLPLTFTPQNGAGLPAQPGTDAVTLSSLKPALAGVFSWQGSYPAALTSQWQPGKPGVILAGAIMSFQSDHGLPTTGTTSRALWQAVLAAVELGQRNQHGYTFTLASKATPNTLTVWHNGVVVMHGLANTGAAASPTPDGTWPVYLRRRSQIMRGLTASGVPYADPAQFVSYFHGNYAVHSMARASYGTPQSQGCVELPLSEARQVWPYLTYGSLVTVVG